MKKHYYWVRIEQKALWRMLRPEVRQVIEERAAMPYGLFRLCRASVPILFMIGVACILSPMILMKGTRASSMPVGLSILLLAGIVVCVVSLIVKASISAAETVYQIQLGTTSGLATSICESGIDEWAGAPEEIKETCHRYLRWLAEEADDARREAVEGIDAESAKAKERNLVCIHKDLRRLGLVYRENPQEYFLKQPAGR